MIWAILLLLAAAVGCLFYRQSCQGQQGNQPKPRPENRRGTDTPKWVRNYRTQAGYQDVPDAKGPSRGRAWRVTGPWGNSSGEYHEWGPRPRRAQPKKTSAPQAPVSTTGQPKVTVNVHLDEAAITERLAGILRERQEKPAAGQEEGRQQKGGGGK